MAVTSVEQIWPGRGGSDDIEKRTQLTHVYRVVTDDINDDATVAGGTALLPRLGDPHPNYPDAYVVFVDPQQLEDDPNLWDVTVRYSSELPSRAASSGNGVALGPGPESIGIGPTGEPTNTASPTERPVNPINRPAVWRRHRVEQEEPLEFDANGDTILNSAGLPYDPPLMTKYRYSVLSLVKNVAGISEDTINQYDQTTNETDWKGISAGKALLFIDSAANDLENGVSFTQLSIEVWITRKPDGWLRRVIDQGHYKLTDLGAGGMFWDRFRDRVTGAPKTEPTLLDGAGQPLAADATPIVRLVQEYFVSEFEDFFDLLGVS